MLNKNYYTPKSSLFQKKTFRYNAYLLQRILPCIKAHSKIDTGTYSKQYTREPTDDQVSSHRPDGSSRPPSTYLKAAKYVCSVSIS